MPRVSITIPEKSPQPYRFKLDREKVTIGRSSNNDIVVDCPSVSSLHCTMERAPGGYLLRDRKSTNGIKSDGEKMAVVDLVDKSLVLIGDVKFEYRLADEELDELDEEEFRPQAKKMSEVTPTAKKVEKREPAPKPKMVPATPRPPQAPQVPLPSTTQGSDFMFWVAVIFFGALAFLGGMSQKYAANQEKLGRKGEISFFKDLINGRPALEEEKSNQDE